MGQCFPFNHIEVARHPAALDAGGYMFRGVGSSSDPCTIESDEVGATKLLPKETEKWYELSVTNLSANYDGPSGGQRDPDIDGETDTDAATATAIGTDTDSYTSVEGDINDGPDGDLEDDSDSNENLPQPLLETLYGSSSDHEREELMQAIRVDQLVTKAPIDPRRDLKGLCWPGIQRYTRELAEGIGKQLALEVAGLLLEKLKTRSQKSCKAAQPRRLPTPSA
ncbi:hypothetical protein CEP52_016259 [Fusarium oligoseptatum]|uniref:Uncharacterized protein n=1 Tax=Fusarium oligoseptatum TaxID=2604345 RepID=A0A428S5C3_9HYPO|nr:hypothetical protein CEP52_016259 [Fusarium oligoseptatum]